MENPNTLKMANPNRNWLAGMQCPECKFFGPFAILVSILATVYDDGLEIDDYSDYEYEGATYCRCLDCDAVGGVTEFRLTTTEGE